MSLALNMRNQFKAVHEPLKVVKKCRMMLIGDAMTGSYVRGSHSKKLEPIIASLDRFDNDVLTWAPLKERVDALKDGWDQIIGQVKRDSPEHALLSRQRDICFEALQLQSEFFHSHRVTCVRALKLRRD